MPEPRTPRRVVLRTACASACVTLALPAANAQDAAPVGHPADATPSLLRDYSGWSPGDGDIDASSELDEIYANHKGSIPATSLESPLNWLVEQSRRLQEQTGLRIGMAYTAMYMQATGPGVRNGAAGDFDLITDWTLVGRGTKNTGRLIFTAEHRHQIDIDPPSQLRGELGTLQFPTNAFNDRGLVIRDFQWLQRLFDDKVRIGIGRGDSSDFVGMHQMQNINNSFVNRAFSANSVTPFPGHGTAAGISFRPNDQFYVTAGGANAYGRTTVSDFDTLDEGDFFTYIEGGWTPTFDNVGRGRYSLFVWHMDSRDSLGIGSDSGFSVILNQNFGERWQAFARFSYADEGISGIKNSTEIGGGYRGLLGSPENLTGLAAAYSSPTNDTWDDEKIVEAFHRWQLTAHTQFSVSAQAIIDPSNNPDQDVIGAFAARIRIAF